MSDQTPSTDDLAQAGEEALSLLERVHTEGHAAGMQDALAAAADAATTIAVLRLGAGLMTALGGQIADREVTTALSESAATLSSLADARAAAAAEGEESSG